MVESYDTLSTLFFENQLEELYLPNVCSLIDNIFRFQQILVKHFIAGTTSNLWTQQTDSLGETRYNTSLALIPGFQFQVLLLARHTHYVEGVYEHISYC